MSVVKCCEIEDFFKSLESASFLIVYVYVNQDMNIVQVTLSF
jgi:hypothetical protein